MHSGIAYVVLNILRLMTVLTLLLICVASVLIMTVQFQHFGRNFFSIINELSTIVSAMILITTEIPTTAVTAFYKRRCAVWTQGFSLAWSGVPMVVMACSMLSWKADTTNSASRVRTSIVLGSGISLGVLGLIYCLMPLFYW